MLTAPKNITDYAAEWLTDGVVYRYSTALDNYDTPRNYEYGWGVRGINRHTGVDVVVLFGADGLPSALGRKTHIVWDDGASADIRYCAGWHNERNAQTYWHRFPVNPDGELRPDGHPIDFRNWMLGPCRTYHLKVTRILDRDDERRWWTIDHDYLDHPVRFKGMTGLVDEIEGGIVGWFHDSAIADDIAKRLNRT